MTLATVYVDSETTIEDTVTTVGSGTRAIVWLSTTVSYVDTGRVSVSVTERGNADDGTL